MRRLYDSGLSIIEQKAIWAKTWTQEPRGGCQRWEMVVKEKGKACQSIQRNSQQVSRIDRSETDDAGYTKVGAAKFKDAAHG